MNLQSNALKFTKEGGAIKIVCTYVKPGKKNTVQNKYTGHDSYSSKSEKSSSDSENSQNSENSQFNKEHKIDSLFDPDPIREKIVIQVLDSGIGIKKKDKVKLFKLFGCLQNTRQMNTQGIGLGLVISENIVKSFNGRIGVKSKYGRGTKFAFSIILGKDDDFVDNMNDGIVLQQPSNRSINASSNNTGSAIQA